MNLGIITCPKCKKSFSLDADELLISGSDYIADICPNCNVTIIIDQKDGYPIIKAIDDPDKADRIMLGLD